jgi:hypothetical protein
MCATPKTSSPSATCGPRETVFSSLGALTFLGGYTIHKSALQSIVSPQIKTDKKTYVRLGRWWGRSGRVSDVPCWWSCGEKLEDDLMNGEQVAKVQVANADRMKQAQTQDKSLSSRPPFLDNCAFVWTRKKEAIDKIWPKYV